MRTAEIKRTTAETDISLRLVLEGTGKGNCATGCGFLDHMLVLFARHGRFDLELTCAGDTDVDYHHTVEDVGICLGDAFRQALGDKRGVRRYGQSLLPMDETLILAAADLSGRGGYYGQVEIPTQKVGDFDTELFEEFWIAFARQAQLTLHLQKMAGVNSHHIMEGAFKAAARCLRTAVAIDPEFAGEIPSTKGVL